MVSSNHYDLDIDTTLGGSNASDYVVASQKAIKDYVDNHTGGIPNPAYGTSSTAAATAQKVVSIPAITSLNVGQVLYIRPSTTSTVANSTIKLNDFDPYPMRYNNAAITTSTDSIVWNAAFVSIFVFDGTYWQFAGHGLDSNTTYSAMSVSEGTTGTATSSRVMRADYLKQIIQGTKLTGLSTSDSSDVVATDTVLSGIGKLQAQINASKILINITYDDLVTLKTNGELYEGAFYRIVDFVTTSNGASPNNNEPSRSAEHQFDIIIQALGTSNLADKGTCALHENDTYFANNNLGAWQIWYDIANDTTKYAWADTTNGKGVIYRMIDEFGNDLPYDFKNIQYYRDSANYSSISTYLTANDGYYYTFSKNTSGTITDKSLDALTHDNIIGQYVDANNTMLLLNTVFVHTSTTVTDTNNIGSSSYNNTFVGSCYGNTIGMVCHDNIIGNNFFYNTIGQAFRDNAIGSGFSANSIGNYCYNNTFTTGFTQNEVGNNFYNNTFNGATSNNTIMQNVHDLTVGANFKINIVGNTTSNMTIGTGCQVNVFNNNVRYMTIPDSMLNLDIASYTLGSSSAYLDLTGLPTSAKYPIYLRRDTNVGFIATWNDGITTYGKYKATAATANWTDVNNKQIQSDWNQSDSTAVDYIKNKPTIPSGVVVDQTYDGTSANAQSGVAIEGELTTNYQSKLVPGTNIKTINNTSLLGSGNIPALENTATATRSITVDGIANTIDGLSINIGEYSEVANSTKGGDVVIGTGPSASLNAAATGGGCTAIGYRAKATGEYSIQLGWGTNSTNKMFAVGFQGTNWDLLNGTTGLIPDDRLSSNIAKADLSNVPTTKGILTESYVNGTSGYRVYADNYCVQWGRFTGKSGTITLLKSYADTNYCVAYSSSARISWYCTPSTVNTMSVASDSNSSYVCYWITTGFIGGQ